jgi:hypothetical protein
MLNNSQVEFWKEIKIMNNCQTPLPAHVDGVTGEKHIAKMWRAHFQGLFNCVDASRPSISDDFYCSDSNEDVYVSPLEVERAVMDLPTRKSCGMDGLTSEHIQYSSKLVLKLLCQCFTSLFIHGFLPDSLMKVVLVPVIKDKAKGISCKNNYRPIALASVMSKVIEKILLCRIENYLITSPNQFEFKGKHSTDQCIFILKEIIDYYKNLNATIFVTYLDASKAFDRINHCKLFDKLIQRNVPQYVVRLLIYWYSNQKFCVKWGNTHSDMFNVSNGVRQGGILSPYLFNVYFDSFK